MNSDISYDPKFGFKMRNMTLKKSGYYKCQIEDSSGTTQELNYHLNVFSKIFQPFSK